MPRPTSFAKVEIETGERSEPAERPDSETPFRIAVLGDFSGRENRGVLDARLQGRKPVVVDRDNFDNVMARVAPELHLPLGGHVRRRRGRSAPLVRRRPESHARVNV